MVTGAPIIPLDHGEYMPLIPHSISRPRSPVDPPPLLLEEPPAGWWERSAQQWLLEAASNIVQLMQTLDY